MPAIIFIVLTVLFWGAGAFLGKSVLKNFSALHIYLLEALGTLTIAFLVALFYKQELLTAFHNFKWQGYLFGILWGLGTVTFVLALKLKPASVVVPFTALYPIITVMLAILLLKEVISLKIAAGIIFAVVAAFLLL